MNRASKRLTRQQARQRSRKLLGSAHILIAVVALLECALLMIFSTYSWIESSSSLIIMNGPRSTVETDVYNIDIADDMNYMLDLDEEGDLASLNSFFRSVKYYEFAKGTSPDGVNMFFPLRNNTYTSSSAFRKGDTTDYNTSYYYIDFIINNSVGSKDIYFDEDYSDIFSVSSDELSATECAALRSAMRLSITTQVGSGTADTHIYSSEAHTSSSSPYVSINPSASAYTDAALGYAVTTRDYDDYIYAIGEGTVPTSSKLFTARKNKATKVSIRIWFEIMDPTFQSAFGFSQDTHSFTSESFAKIPGATIGINFALKCTDNDYQALYFDDYTFSNSSGATHLTDEQSGYSMWFYAYQPATTNPPRSAGYVWLQLTEDTTSATRNRWYTGDATTSMMEYIQGIYDSGNGSPTGTYTGAYFAYANSTHTNVAYRWNLNSAPDEDSGDFVYDAYSYTRTAASTGYGAGIWDDSENYTMTLLRFRDMTTAVTGTDYNAASDSITNTRFMSSAASTASSDYKIYVNNTTAAPSATTAPYTAGMHYDATEEVFESYVPTAWLVGDTATSVTAGCYFRYCSTPYFASANVKETFYGTSPAQNGGSYIYTAVGYIGTNTAEGGTYDGVGTWGGVEQISFSTELIDSAHRAAYRYYVGVTGYSSSSRSSNVNYYVMIPDATNTVFSAYIPTAVSTDTAGAVRFEACDAINSSTAVGQWSSNARNAHTTFYPVTMAASNAVGYWNVSVLVDGSYEHLIYDTLTDDLPTAQYGTLEYSYDGSSWITIANDANNTISNNLDQYRFYASAEGYDTVYWRWTPYDGTVFTYTHDTTSGIYLLVTEAANAVDITAMTPAS